MHIIAREVMDLRVLLYGGDARTAMLAQLLISDGDEVSCYALENAALPDGARHAQSAADFDCVLLPVPAGTNGRLTAPFSQRPHELTEVVSALSPGTLLCGGKLPEPLVTAAKKRGAAVFDILSDPAFTVGNAEVTAEAAVSLLMAALKKTLAESRVLIVGYGRIARLLSAKLRALGVAVCVLSRSAQSRAMARALGCTSLAPDAPPEALSRFDAAVNTAPAPFALPMSGFDRKCLLLELASAPYGFDAEDAVECGLSYRLCTGLPGKYAPESAAGLIFRAVKNKMEEISHGKA